MSRSIDKNDVDLKKLFQWGREVTLNIYGNEIKLYMRIIGDAETNQARVHALRRSSELRKKLKDLTSDERIAFIPEYDLISKEDLVNGLLTLSIKTIMSRANDEINIPLPAEPTSDSTLEEQEEYQRKVDEYPLLREQAIKSFIEMEIKKEEKRFRGMEKDVLYGVYETMAINQLCEIEMLTAFREMSTYFSVYVDEKFTHRLFDHLDEFRNLPTESKNELIQSYIDLDIDGEVLKKSLVQTQ